jgi:hypothetical protein
LEQQAEERDERNPATMAVTTKQHRSDGFSSGGVEVTCQHGHILHTRSEFCSQRRSACDTFQRTRLLLSVAIQRMRAAGAARRAALLLICS